MAESSSGRAAVLGQQWQNRLQSGQAGRAAVDSCGRAAGRGWQSSSSGRAEWQSSSGSHKVATGSPLGRHYDSVARSV